MRQDMAMESPDPWIIGHEAKCDPAVSPQRNSIPERRVHQIVELGDISSWVVDSLPASNNPKGVPMQMPRMKLCSTVEGQRILKDEFNDLALSESSNTGFLAPQDISWSTRIIQRFAIVPRIWWREWHVDSAWNVCWPSQSPCSLDGLSNKRPVGSDMGDVVHCPDEL
jgi:hypothetical protein